MNADVRHGAREASPMALALGIGPRQWYDPSSRQRTVAASAQKVCTSKDEGGRGRGDTTGTK